RASSTSRPPACIIQVVMSCRHTPHRVSVSSSTSETWSAANIGTARVRMFRNSPPRLSKRNASRSSGLIRDPDSCHLILRRSGLTLFDSTAAPAPSPKRQALIRTPGSLSKYIAALQTSTQIESTCSTFCPANSVAATCQSSTLRIPEAICPRKIPRSAHLLCPPEYTVEGRHYCALPYR